MSWVVGWTVGVGIAAVAAGVVAIGVVVAAESESGGE